MTALETQGISLHYEMYGDPAAPAVLLLSGLAGVGASWSNQISRFAARYHMIVLDQRGTGQSSRTDAGHSTQQLAADLAGLVDHLGVGPTHVVGASTGGAIAQYLALDHPRTVGTLTLVASFARDNPEQVSAWIERASALPRQPCDIDISLRRIDMIAAHDTLARLAHIASPTLVICGEHDFCTPLPLSREIAAGIPDTELAVPGCGHFVEHELEERFFDLVSGFIERRR